MNYDLAEIAPSPSRGRDTVALPVIEGSLRAEKAYLKILREMLLALAGVTREEILPDAQREIARQQAVQDAVPLADAMTPSLWDRIRALAAGLAQISSRMVDRVLVLESQRHTDTFMETAQEALGVDLRAVVRQQDLGDLLDAVSIRNAALIVDVSQDVINRVAQATIRGVLAGAGQKVLKSEIKGIFELTDRRAKLIARDQTAKLNSDLNRFRQEQAGVGRYTWRTSQDERVRPRHRNLDGRVYRWDEKTGAESGLPPGQPVQCRCVAQGLVDF